MTKLIFGCGYLGERVARRWREAGDRVTVATRCPTKATSFQRDGYDAIIADVTQASSLKYLPPADTVLFAVGFDRRVGGSIEEVYAGGVKNVLAALTAGVSRFIYISTTGVYGKGSGEWVDEATPPDPQRDGGKASLAAEQLLATSRFADRSVVLRLAGIYGPGRVPFLDTLRAGEPIPAVPTGHLNLIHVDDAAAIVDAAATHRRPRNVYCVSDGHPVLRGDYYQQIARLVGAPPPNYVKPDLNSPRAARAEADRRVNNARMFSDFDVTLNYPDYRAGLAAILAPG